MNSMHVEVWPKHLFWLNAWPPAASRRPPLSGFFSRQGARCPGWGERSEWLERHGMGSFTTNMVVKPQQRCARVN